MDELKNCCGTTCDKELIASHFEDALKINARLHVENEQLRRKINDIAHRMQNDNRTLDIYKTMNKHGFVFFSAILILNMVLWIWLM